MASSASPPAASPSAGSPASLLGGERVPLPGAPGGLPLGVGGVGLGAGGLASLLGGARVGGAGVIGGSLNSMQGNLQGNLPGGLPGMGGQAQMGAMGAAGMAGAGLPSLGQGGLGQGALQGGNLSALLSALGGPPQQLGQLGQQLGSQPALPPPQPGWNALTSASGFANHAGGHLPPPPSEEDKIYGLILDLTNPATREQALLELSKKREAYEDLAPILWHSFGVISALLQEIISVYPILFPPTLTGHASNRVCNTLALLQCVASHNETRGLFLNAHIPLFLYPFLNTTSKTRPFEYLRLTSLGVIGALVKNDSPEVIQFLLSTEIVPLCLRIMESGSELSKTVAIFIVQKILLDDSGLGYICQTYERFYAVATVLNNMVGQLVEAGGGNGGGRLLKHVVRCYLRLSDNPRAREALRQCLPDPLRDGTFAGPLKDDVTTKRCLATLLVNLGEGGGMVG
ncbi:cell differentiation family, Rcd1-like-domain-containing protein [Hyaloraphidium curvatum]|nr:cell differentiation family, Rcd1-like-domain-containing protein [Hyaloraphidium curvatum]